MMDYCTSHKSLFPNFREDVWDLLPMFCCVIHHFAYETESVVRDLMNSRSPLEIEILNGLEDDDEEVLEDFFGDPIKLPNEPLRREFVSDPVLRALGGAYPEQTIYIREAAAGVKFYAALWPWKTYPGVVTLHFGMHDENSGAGIQEIFRNFLREIPA